MALPSPLSSPSASYALLPPDLAGARGGRDPAVRALEPPRALGDALQRPVRHFVVGAEPEAQKDPRPGVRGHTYRAPTDGHATAAASYPEDSAPFLVQLLGQDHEQPQVFVAEHRDAAALGSDAYRRIGATPPIYSEQPTLFSFAI